MISRNVVIQLLQDKLRGREPLSEQELPAIKILIKEVSSLAQIRRLEIESYQRISQACPEIKIPEEININVPDEKGDTALIIAARNGHEQAVQALLEAKADINIKNKKGDTALIEATHGDHLKAVQTLLEAKADPDIKGWLGFTALILASSHYNLEIVQALIKANANLDLQRDDGDTALIWAASGTNKDIPLALLNAGAKLEFVSERGTTALDEAVQYKRIDIVSLLLSSGALIKHSDKLFDFLFSADQKNPDVRASFSYLSKHWSALTPKSVKEAKSPNTSANSHELVIYISAPTPNPTYPERPFFSVPRKPSETDPLISKDSKKQNNNRCRVM